MKHTVYLDGACGPRNPGGAMGWGANWFFGDRHLMLFGGVQGKPENTNNVAEYLAMFHFLSALPKVSPPCNVSVFSDSDLMISQMSGAWKLKPIKPLKTHVQFSLLCEQLEQFPEVKQKKISHYRPLAIKTLARLNTLKKNGYTFNLMWIPREKNEEADSLSKLMLF